MGAGYTSGTVLILGWSAPRPLDAPDLDLTHSPCEPITVIAPDGNAYTHYVYHVSPGPQLCAAAAENLILFPDRASAEAYLGAGGWLESWGPMSAASDWHVRVAAANLAYALVTFPGDSWLS
ncbi:hypothetical protein D3875_21410 [Deinococcus cavernae]|uniref:Uncharacterized protein n=1 Tax=Deinococcus cavernae TaxID=2320857 RepID=A0A418UZJ7_9DEIO|nr:hypothetical protein [Deinococcus cavernae]RJF68910.1 hypothetical protein D3875_21410 [Deinococcus cavernae]